MPPGAMERPLLGSYSTFLPGPAARSLPVKTAKPRDGEGVPPLAESFRQSPGSSCCLAWSPGDRGRGRGGEPDLFPGRTKFRRAIPLGLVWQQRPRYISAAPRRRALAYLRGLRPLTYIRH